MSQTLVHTDNSLFPDIAASSVSCGNRLLTAENQHSRQIRATSIHSGTDKSNNSPAQALATRNSKTSTTEAGGDEDIIKFTNVHTSLPGMYRRHFGKNNDAGAWDERRHPQLTDEKSVHDIVKALHVMPDFDAEKGMKHSKYAYSVTTGLIPSPLRTAVREEVAGHFGGTLTDVERKTHNQLQGNAQDSKVDNLKTFSTSSEEANTTRPYSDDTNSAGRRRITNKAVECMDTVNSTKKLQKNSEKRQFLREPRQQTRETTTKSSKDLTNVGTSISGTHRRHFDMDISSNTTDINSKVFNSKPKDGSTLSTTDEKVCTGSPYSDEINTTECRQNSEAAYEQPQPTDRRGTHDIVKALQVMPDFDTEKGMKYSKYVYPLATQVRGEVAGHSRSALTDVKRITPELSESNVQDNEFYKSKTLSTSSEEANAARSYGDETNSAERPRIMNTIVKHISTGTPTENIQKSFTNEQLPRETRQPTRNARIHGSIDLNNAAVTVEDITAAEAGIPEIQCLSDAQELRTITFGKANRSTSESTVSKETQKSTVAMKGEDTDSITMNAYTSSSGTCKQRFDKTRGPIKGSDPEAQTQKPDDSSQKAKVDSSSCTEGDIGWSKAQKFSRKPCTTPPSPHPSDGGVTRTPIGSSVYEGPCALPDDGRQYRTRDKIRLPSIRERKRAAQNQETIAFAVKSKRGRSSIWLSREQASAEAEVEGRFKIFEEYASLTRNIRAAKKWITTPAFDSNAQVFRPTVLDEETTQRRIGATSGFKGVKCCQSRMRKSESTTGKSSVSLKACAANFIPTATCTGNPVNLPSAKTEKQNWPQLRTKSISEKSAIPEISLRKILKHSQVSHVRCVSKDIRKQMKTHETCRTHELTMDLKGHTAGSIQRQLRKDLVVDLAAGNDTAAFVCSQLGIDNAPRCDQLELLMAAMPGRASIEFEGDRAESGLDIAEWLKGHASHCKRGCDHENIEDDCYFKIMHHFLLRGFEPTLKQGRSWDELKTTTEAYIHAWNSHPEQCKAAWDKWKRQAAGLLSEPTTEEPKLVIPLFPAIRSKHLWRFHKDGTPYKVRLCLDLKSAEVNEITEDWKFKYRGLDDIAARINQGDWLASVDISRFYLRLPAGKGLRSAQWIQDPTTYAKSKKANRNYKHKRWRQLLAIGFGLKTAPAWASAVSAELVRILEAAGVRVAGCFLDDILIAAPSKVECEEALQKAVSIMGKLGIPANDKTVPPQAPEDGIVYLGMHIRTSDMRLTVSKEHRDYAIDRLGQVLRNGSATKRELASVAGVLTWISYVFLSGKPRRQHIYSAAGTGEDGDKSEKVEITGALKRQMQWWLAALQRKSFKGTRVWDIHANPRTLLMESDASGIDGWGACVRGIHLVGPWPAELKETNMLFKELVPITIMLSLLARSLPETVFAAATDNTGSAFAVNRLTCRDNISRRLLQQLSQELEQGGHTAIASHVYRHRNQHADDLSHALKRYQWARIVKQQKTLAQPGKEGYWYFPFVAHCMRTGDMFSGIFRMCRHLFSSMKR